MVLLASLRLPRKVHKGLLAAVTWEAWVSGRRIREDGLGPEKRELRVLPNLLH